MITRLTLIPLLEIKSWNLFNGSTSTRTQFIVCLNAFRRAFFTIIPWTFLCCLKMLTVENVAKKFIAMNTPRAHSKKEFSLFFLRSFIHSTRRLMVCAVIMKVQLFTTCLSTEEVHIISCTIGHDDDDDNNDCSSNTRQFKRKRVLKWKTEWGDM